MRKVKLFGLLLVAVLVLTGCGASEKTLTCTNTEEQSGIKMDQTVVMKFKKDKVNYVKVTLDQKATNSTLEDNWDMFTSVLDEQFKPKDKDGVKLSTKNDKDNHTYKIEIEIDLNKATDDALSEYDLDGITDSKSTYEDTKKDAEKDGFTCK